ncbi:PAS domain S-box protein, partial [bacterium]|nr:PAS domain S-box protein [bacterium]
MSKIRKANLLRRTEQEQLSAMVSEKTMQLELNNVATLNLLEDLQKEIDARRKTETELLRSEARLRRAELASKSGNWEYNHETKIFHLSDGAAFVLGFSDTNIDYQTFVELIAETDRNVFEHSLKQLITNGLPFNAEIKFLPYAQTEAIDIRIFAVKEKDDQLVFGVLRNISEQKQANEKLVESELKFRELMDNSPEGITI